MKPNFPLNLKKYSRLIFPLSPIFSKFNNIEIPIVPHYPIKFFSALRLKYIQFHDIGNLHPERERHVKGAQPG